jgi:hypothetical protein
MLKNYKDLNVWQRAYGLCLETQVMLSGDLGYINGDIMTKLHENISEVERMLKALIRSLESKI